MKQNKKIIIKSWIQRVKIKIQGKEINLETGKISEYKLQRRTKQCRITEFNDGTIEYKILPCTIVSKDNIILEWIHGPTPTPKASKKYSKEQLKSFGYSDELINTIYRGYSAKDIKKIRKKFKDKETNKLLSKEETEKLIKQYKFVSKIPGY